MTNVDALACINDARLMDYAYQPIVSTSSLVVHGFEALARPDPHRFASIMGMLDFSHDAQILGEVEQLLLHAAISKFSARGIGTDTKLFCNLDNRTYDGEPLARSALAAIVGQSGFPMANLCMEISESQPVLCFDNLRNVTDMLVNQDAKIAIDDFGIGNSGLHMLLKLEPNYVKIDQFFVDGLATSTRKQAIVAKLCGLAHALGFSTVAEGVESIADFRMARDLGCDLAQGYVIARPTTVLGELRDTYDAAVRGVSPMVMAAQVAQLLTPMEPLVLDQPIVTAVALFQSNPTLRMVPVVSRDGTVQGAIYEDDVRQLMLSEFGRSLMANKGMDSRVSRLIRRCPMADGRGTVEAIVNSYVAAETAYGLVLVDDGRFLGYLSNNAVLRLAAEREINQAREQNPLTRLPGNAAIDQYFDEISASSEQCTIAYLDFDNFKAFNDAYGFAMGDRALQMFADMLRKLQSKHRAFIGHVGGDDFLLSLPLPETQATKIIERLRARFARDAESLYSAEDRALGGISAIDRFGVARFYPLLGVSAGVVQHSPGKDQVNRDHILRELASAKLQAKRAKASISKQDVQVAQIPRKKPSLAA